ncbi:Uncharacterised protein [Vibrio cholerae]|nr:Uncharacterised protein [Vibrio cholerae]
MAIVAPQFIGFGQFVEISPYGLWANIKSLNQLFRTHKTLGLNQFNDFLMALYCFHREYPYGLNCFQCTESVPDFKSWFAFSYVFFSFLIIFHKNEKK